jgi:predicted Rossmann-fold nucleotide-binding protein
MQIKSLALFCGSKTGNNSIYGQHATELGKLLAANKISLIFGGGKNGFLFSAFEPPN